MSIMKSPTFRFSAVGAAAIAIAALSAPAQAAGDAAAGEGVFRKCQSCHNIGPNAKNKVGPALTGVIGRQAGSVEKFRYGASIVKLGETGFAWSEEEIVAYLEDPRAFLRAKLDDPKARSKMAFKLRSEQDRMNVAAYIATFSEPAEEAAAVVEEAAAETQVAEAADSSAMEAMEEAEAAMAKAGEAMKEADAAMTEAKAAMQSKDM